MMNKLFKSVIVPVLFYLITRAAYGKKGLAELQKSYKPDPDRDAEV